MLLGRTAIVKLGMIPSTMHAAVLYQSKVGPEVIMSEYQDIKRCEQIKKVKGEKVSRQTIVNPKYLEQTGAIKKNLPTRFKQKLIKLLQDNVDMFVWKYSDLTRIPRIMKLREETLVTEHKLNEDKKITNVQQRSGVWPQSVAWQPQRK
ncbi:hypothetical protein Tco_0439705 [Tanacetum coccineum]